MSLGAELRRLRVEGPPYRTLREAARLLECGFVHLSQVEADRVKPQERFIAEAALLYDPDALDHLLGLLADWSEAPPPDLSRTICSGRTLR